MGARFDSITSVSSITDSTAKISVFPSSENAFMASLSVLKTFMSSSPTLVTPALGTPASGALDNCTLTHTQIPLPKVSYKTWTVTAANLVDGGGAVGTYTLPSTGIPAGAILLGSMVVVTAGFAGDVSATLKIGDGTDDDRYMTGTPSIFGAAATGIQTGVPSGDKLILTVNSPVVTVTSASDITPVLAGGGSMTIAIYYIQTA